MKRILLLLILGMFGCTAITPDVDVVDDDSFDSASFDSAQEPGSDDSDSVDDTEGGFDSAQPGDSESGGDLDTDTDTDTTTNTDSDTTADSDTVADTDTNIDSDTDADTDTGADSGTDSEVDSDSSADSDSDTAVRPTITGIEGTGSASGINPLAADQAAYDSYAGNRTDANNRISSVEQELVVSGSNLDGVTSAQAVGQNSQGTIDFDIVEATMNQLKIKFPNPITVTAGGLFVLTLATLTTSVDAQVFFLQGEQGVQGEKGDKGDEGTVAGISCAGGACTVAGDLVVEGNLSAESQDCPFGYQASSIAEGILCTKGLDEMVQVGDFWIDKYEVSMWKDKDCSEGPSAGVPYGIAGDNYPGGFPDKGAWTTPVYACSVSGVTPSTYATWFQMQQACSLAGKSLCSNAQWQAAAIGTYDPGSFPESYFGDGCQIDSVAGSCNTCSNSSRTTGSATAANDSESCRSNFGAEDMIGNVYEWTSDWWGMGSDSWSAPQPSEYNDDYAVNVDPAQYQGSTYFPGAALRGGYASDGTNAGVYSLWLNNGPSVDSFHIGARCCISQ
jgi:formylglycine-generating enzyme required for sulfatase activity